VKTFNRDDQVGHLEGAAGLAGLIKSIFILERGVIPASIHFENANPSLRFEKWGIEVPTESTPWPTQGLRRLSVNSFGFGGTNAHAILDDAGHYLAERGFSALHSTIMEESSTRTIKSDGHDKGEDNGNGTSDEEPNLNRYTTDDTPEASSSAGRQQLIVLSAYDQETVARMKQAYATYLQNSLRTLEGSKQVIDFELRNLAFTLGSKRSRLPWKTFVTASSTEELITRLTSGSGKSVRSSAEPRIAFVFTGQGAQWPRMGIELVRYQPFARSVGAAEAFLSSLGCEWSVTQELSRQSKTSRMDMSQFSQPICTIIQLALVDLLRSWNILPTAVVGHSSGEIAAAYCCGAISAEDAWKIAYYRGLYSSKIRSLAPSLEGLMMAVGLPEKEANDRMPSIKSGRLVIAAINAPASVTISGDRKAIEEFHDILNSEGVFARKLKVDNAYHSHHMEVVAEAYRNSIGNISVTTPRDIVKMFSSVTGKIISADKLGPDYWITNLVSPVRFSDALGSLLTHSRSRKRRAKALEVDLFLELGPHPALRGPVKQTLESLSPKTLPYCSLLERGKSDIEVALEAAGMLFTFGSPVNILKVNTRDDLSKSNQHLVDLPPYPWNHSQTFWHESRISKGFRFRKHACHDLLGAPAPNFNPIEPQWRNVLRTSTHPWIRDHVIQDSILYPAAGLVLMVIEAARQVANSDKTPERYDLRDVRIGKAVVVPDDDVGVECLLQIRPRKAGTRADIAPWFEFTIFTSDDAETLVENCSGLLSIKYETNGASSSAESETAIENQAYREKYWNKKQKSNAPEDMSKFYTSLAKAGLTYGPFFQNVTQLSKGDSYCCSSVRVPDSEALDHDADDSSYILHPGTLDCMFQTAFAGFGRQRDQLREAMVPIFIQSISVSAHLPKGKGANYIGYATSSERGFREIESNIVMLGPDGNEPKIVIKGFQCIQITAMTGVIPRKNVENYRKRIASKFSWKPDVDLLPPSQLKEMVERATVKATPELPISTDKLELTAFVYINQLLKNVPYEKVDVPYIKLFYQWMQMRLESVERASNPHQTSGLDWMNIAEETKESLFAEVRASGSHGEALCVIGNNLEKIVTGKIEPLQVLLENDLLYRFYREAKEMQYMNLKLSKVS
jgi:acyl transferase domain-containing protein